MASNAQRPTTTTTTTTSTSTTFSQSRNPRSASTSNLHPSSASIQAPSIVVTQDQQTPQTSNNNVNTTSTEPFPSFTGEPPRNSQLSQVHTIDFYPMSSVTTRSSQRHPAQVVSTQMRQRPIGIKRLSSQQVPQQTTGNDTLRPNEAAWAGRRRSTSAPQRPTMLEEAQDGGPLQHSMTATTNLPVLTEGAEFRPQDPQEQTAHAGLAPSRTRGGSQRLRRVSDATRSAVSRLSNRSDDAPEPTDEYDARIVDILDVMDPEVSTLTTLTNVQNSLFVPDLGRWLNRRPTFELTKSPSYRNQRPTLNRGPSKPLPPTPTPGPPPMKEVDVAIPSDIEEETESSETDRRLSLASVPSIASVVQEEHYAVLPHGVSLDGWTEEEKELLDDYVRHMLHSKREGFKRSMRAFGKYISKPLGFFVTLYAVLITLFGLAWVLFLIGWISVGAKQLYVINVIDNVLVALFAIMGDGLAPFRAVDTYHMGFIAYYHHLTEKIRKKRELPGLADHNELPEIHESEVDVETAVKEGDAEFSVLTPEQQKRLEHHQNKFSKSHSFYKPHETMTHNAFPHHLFIAIVVLLDLHSCFQIALGSCTWGISYHVRPKALTPTILSCSITVNITAGILINIGDRKTRKKDVLTRMFRQELTKDAMQRVEKDKSEGRRISTKPADREKKTVHDRIDEEDETNRFSASSMEYPSIEPKS